MATAETQKAYRQRMREEMGEAKYRAEEARKRKERRARAKNPMVELQTPANLGIDEETGIKRNSLNDYQKKFNRLKTLMEIDDDTDEWLKDHKAVISFIKHSHVRGWKKEDTRITYLTHIHAYVMREPDLQDVEPYYRKAMEGANKKRWSKRQDQELKEEWHDQYLEWQDIRDFADTDKLDQQEKIVFDIYTLIPPRRTGTIASLQKNTGDNVIKDGYIILTRYKTDSVYGKYEAKLPKALAKKLADYMVDMKDGEYLFTNTKSRPYSSNTFTTYVKSLFKKATGFAMTPDILRISYATDFMKSRPKLSKQQTAAKALGHSVAILQTYDRRV